MSNGDPNPHFGRGSESPELLQNLTRPGPNDKSLNL